MSLQRLRQWYNNRGKQNKNSSTSLIKSKSTMKALVRRWQLQRWQAFAVLYAAAVKKEVDERYAAYCKDAYKGPEAKVISRLSIMRATCIEMYEESSDEIQVEVQRRMQDDTLDMPQDLLDAQDALGEEETKRYLENYRRQM